MGGGIQYCSKYDKNHPCIFYAFGDWTGFWGAGGPDPNGQPFIHCSSKLAGMIIQLMPQNGHHYSAEDELGGPLGGKYRIVGNWARGDCFANIGYGSVCPDGRKIDSHGLLDELTRPIDWPLCSKKCYNVENPNG